MFNIKPYFIGFLFGIAFSVVLLCVIALQQPNYPTYDSELYNEIQVGYIVTTTPEYTALFNETFIGYVHNINAVYDPNKDINYTSITLKNRQNETLTINEKWISADFTSYIEERYNITDDYIPHCFRDFEGNYLFEDWWDKVTEDWKYIYTTNGRILKRSDKIYYHDGDKYYGGYEIHYKNHTFFVNGTNETIPHFVII